VNNSCRYGLLHLHGVRQDLRVDVESRVDIGVAHEFRDDFLRHIFIVSPGAIRPSRREPCCVGKLGRFTDGEYNWRRMLFGEIDFPERVQKIRSSCPDLGLAFPSDEKVGRKFRERDCPIACLSLS
jgi:hypothetical protein